MKKKSQTRRAGARKRTRDAVATPIDRIRAVVKVITDTGRARAYSPMVGSTPGETIETCRRLSYWLGNGAEKNIAIVDPAVLLGIAQALAEVGRDVQDLWDAAKAVATMDGAR